MNNDNFNELDNLSTDEELVIEDVELDEGSQTSFVQTEEEEVLVADKNAEKDAQIAKEEAEEISYHKALKKLKLQARKDGQNPEAVVLDRDEYIASIRAKEEVV